MSSVPLERTTRVTSLAVRVVDDVTSKYVPSATLRLSNSRLKKVALPKRDGFHVFADVPAGNYELSIEADDFESFSHGIDLPIAGSVVLDVPGENEVLLSVTASDTSTEVVEFAARHFYTPAEAGTSVVTNRRISSLADTLEGEGVSEATLDEVGSGPTRIRRRDVVRLIGERMVRLRPAPHYRFDGQMRRMSGTLRDSATNTVIDGAVVTLSRIGAETIVPEDVGTTPENTVRVHTVGGSAATKRVVGVTRDVEKTTNARGQYVFYFPRRPDLTIDQVTVSATAPNYTASVPVDVDLTARNESVANFALDRI